jgi:hypothetical protein
MNSRRCNLRKMSGKTQSTREGLTVARVQLLQGGQGFSASASVGCTYGYSRCPASRDGICGMMVESSHGYSHPRQAGPGDTQTTP